MNVSFDLIEKGRQYSRPDLASRWGLASHHGMSRGVFTPRGKNLLILFVTKIKQPGNINYRDFIVDDFLCWEGEAGHGNDQRIISSAENDEQIHLFYREIHHTNFIYMGEIFLTSSNVRTSRPSEFSFSFERASVVGMVAENVIGYRTTSRLQPADDFRVGQIRKWGRCVVTDCSELKLLNACRIKPMKDCADIKDLEDDNGLLLSPTYHTLFRKGYISFTRSGMMKVHEKLSPSQQTNLRLQRDDQLLQKPGSRTAGYLEYHSEVVFGNFDRS